MPSYFFPCSLVPFNVEHFSWSEACCISLNLLYPQVDDKPKPWRNRGNYYYLGTTGEKGGEDKDMIGLGFWKELGNKPWRSQPRIKK